MRVLGASWSQCNCSAQLRAAVGRGNAHLQRLCGGHRPLLHPSGPDAPPSRSQARHPQDGDLLGPAHGPQPTAHDRLLQRCCCLHPPGRADVQEDGPVCLQRCAKRLHVAGAAPLSLQPMQPASRRECNSQGAAAYSTQCDEWQAHSDSQRRQGWHPTAGPCPPRGKLPSLPCPACPNAAQTQPAAVG